MNIKKIALLFLFLFIFNPLQINSEEVDKKNPEERLEYSISWQNFINAGVAVLSLTHKEDRYLMKMNSRSADWLKYVGVKVEDNIMAEADFDLKKSYYFKADIKEGDYKKIKTINFDHEKKEISYFINQEAANTFALPDDTLDVLSALYLTRTKPFIIGGEILVKVFDDKKSYDIKVLVLGKEEVRIKEKKMNAYKTQVILETSGLFNKNGDLFIWFSDDEKKVPLIIKSKIKLGSFYATLEKSSNIF